MARLKSAGLNPNLAYGQVQNANMLGTGGSLPNASAPNLNPGQIDFSLASQIENLQSFSKLSQTQSDLRYAEYLSQMLDSYIKMKT